MKQQQRANILKERLGNAAIGGDRRWYKFILIMSGNLLMS
jgi:hypothetical protein